MKDLKILICKINEVILEGYLVFFIKTLLLSVYILFN